MRIRCTFERTVAQTICSQLVRKHLRTSTASGSSSPIASNALDVGRTPRRMSKRERAMGVQNEDGPERRLAAIFAADVADYSRLMGDDEVETLRLLTLHRE